MADITITQKITIELDGKSPFEYVVMKQGDKGSRILAVSLLQNKQPYEIPTGCTARIKYYKPDGNPVLNDCTLSGNEILVTYTEQMLAAAGVGKGEIVLLKGGKELKSATYYTKIVETVYKTDGFVSDKEFLSMGTIFNDMDQAAQAATANAKIAETAAANANQAANSANSAAEKATSAATKATEAAGAATTAAGNANSAVTKANEATTAAKAATEAAQAVADNVSGIIDEKILEAFFGSMRNRKVYQTELYLSATNPTSDGTKTLANAGKVCEPSTDTVEGQDDYEGIGIFTWFNCNYVTNEYGRKVPTAVEGWGNGFKNDGSVDVGVIAMTPYWNVEEKDGKQIWTLSDTPNDEYGLVGWETAKKEDGNFAPYVVHSKYVSGIGTDGLLRSFKNSKPERNQCYNNMITNYQKKGKGYWGGGKERNLYRILYQIIKYATKNEQTIFQGTTNYNFQYAAAVQRDTKETYFPVTNAQAANVIVGAYVSVGYGSVSGSNVNNDRGVGTIHKYADDVKVLRIEDLDENNKAVYLDVKEGFTTTPVAISGTVSAPITMSSMHWWSGSTDQVIGKHDGSLRSNTDGKHPYRVMGIEDAVGGYIVYADSVMVFKEDYSKDVYIARRGTKHVTDEATIKSTYKLIGNIPANDGADFWIGDIGVDTETCAWFVKAVGSSDRQGWGDRCYAGGKNTSGTREDLGRGGLWNGAYGGPVCVNCWNGLDGSDWFCLGCD
nr:MAG: bppU [Bacteriophage sp.]